MRSRLLMLGLLTLTACGSAPQAPTAQTSPPPVEAAPAPPAPTPTPEPVPLPPPAPTPPPVPAPPPAPAPPDPQRIVAFGDSITWGYLTPETRTATPWPALLEQHLDARGTDMEVVNQGVSGHNTEAALARLERSVLGLNPGTVLIAFGANDCRGQIDAERYRANLNAMVGTLRDRGVRVGLLTITPVRHGDETQARCRAYSQIVREVAAERQVPLLDVEREYPAALAARGLSVEQAMQDGLHPTSDEAYGVLGEVIAAAFPR